MTAYERWQTWSEANPGGTEAQFLAWYNAKDQRRFKRVFRGDYQNYCQVNGITVALRAARLGLELPAAVQLAAIIDEALDTICGGYVELRFDVSANASRFQTLADALRASGVLPQELYDLALAGVSELVSVATLDGYPDATTADIERTGPRATAIADLRSQWERMVGRGNDALTACELEPERPIPADLEALIAQAQE